MIKTSQKKDIFICQITEGALKLIRCLYNQKSKKTAFNALSLEPLALNADNKRIAEKLSAALKKLGYNNQPVILSLPRQYAALRYLKIPSQQPQEIERIVNLQAPHYLPYQLSELITGYQVISTDKQGYSGINMVVVHTDVVKRHLDIFREAKIREFKIVLSSYGLCNLYHYLYPEEDLPVMAVDIDSSQIELAIVSRGKLLFSRSFKLSNTHFEQDKIFIEEIEKTRNAYSKDVPGGALKKITIFGGRVSLEEFAQALKKRIDLPVEISNYNEKIGLEEALISRISHSEGSFAGLFGLGLENIPEALNLIPQNIKELSRKNSRRREYVRSALFIIGAILILMLAISKSLDNKAKYLSGLKLELNKIVKEAKPLEDIDRRLKLLENRLQKKPSGLDALFEAQGVAPANISLLSLAYEEDGEVILRGQAPELNFVLTYLAELEKSPVFKDFNIKIRYATKKNTQRGEMVEFEINCLRK